MIDEIDRRGVTDIIKTFIDNIEEENIEKEALEKIVKSYKDFIDNSLLLLRDKFKKDKDIKKELSSIGKIKVAAKKSIPAKTRIKSYKDKAKKIVLLVDKQEDFSVISSNFNELNTLEKDILTKWNKYEKWFEWVMDYGEYSYLATHISKLSHSSSKGSSIDVRYMSKCEKYNKQYLITDNPNYLDTAYPDNKYSVISELYAEKYKDSYIGDLLRKNPEPYLKPLIKNNGLLDRFSKGISAYIKEENKQSYFLNKQTYFPVGENQYHLLLPLTSSSLVQEIYLEHQKYFNDENKAAREQKKKGLYSAVEVRSYPNKAQLNVTGSNHSNASSLNGKRGGRIALFPTTPPQWQSRYQSAIKKQSVFDAELSYQLKGEITELRKYLVLLKKEQLSLSKPERNAAIARKLSAISDTFFDYIQLLCQNEIDSGWTVHSDMPIEEQLLFEPNRDDEQATAEKSARAWAKKLSQSYGRWLNNQLKNKQLTLTTIHTQLWEQHFFNELREYIAIEEVNV